MEFIYGNKHIGKYGVNNTEILKLIPRSKYNKFITGKVSDATLPKKKPY